MDRHRRRGFHRLSRRGAVPRGRRSSRLDRQPQPPGGRSQPRLAPRPRRRPNSSRPTSAIAARSKPPSPATPTPTPSCTWPRQVAVTTSVLDPREDFDINALGTFNVLEAVRIAGERRPAVLYSSTNKVYGNLEHVRVVERDGRYAYEDLPVRRRTSPNRSTSISPYGCSKGCGDQYVRDYARIYGLRTVAFRQSCIYGTRQFGIEDQGWVAWFCLATPTGQPFTIFGDGKQVRDALWVGDLVDCYERRWSGSTRSRARSSTSAAGRPTTLSLSNWWRSSRPLRPEDSTRLTPTGGRATSGCSWPTSARPAGLLRLAADGVDPRGGRPPDRLGRENRALFGA